MGPHNRTPWNLIHKQHSSLINRQTWHHVFEKSEPQINNINVLQAPFRRLLFNSGLTEESLHLLAGVETYLLETRAMKLRVIGST